MKNIVVGDLIRVDYEKEKVESYWRKRNKGIPASIHGTRISEFDDDMKMTFVPCGTILPVLDVRTEVDEDTGLCLRCFFCDRSRGTAPLG